MRARRITPPARERSETWSVSLLFALGLVFSPFAAQAQDVARVSVSEARFRFFADDGSELPLEKTIGAKLSARMDDGSVKQIRVDSAEFDPRDPYGEVILYEFSVQNAEGRWTPYCEPDPDGRRTGFPLSARQMGGETRDGGFFITCTGGAYGKCVRFGYRPWRGEDGSDLYRSCFRMVRADYCGDGVGHTRNGTPINIYDPQEIQKRDDVPGMSFEAGWGPDGAVCVNKTRLPKELPLEKLFAECPRLRAPGVPTECNEASALAQGARILNESY